MTDGSPPAGRLRTNRHTMALPTDPPTQPALVVLGPDHPSTLLSRNNLAAANRAAGRSP